MAGKAGDLLQLMPLLRAAALLCALYRLFGVSLAGGANMLLPNLPAIMLIGLTAVPLALATRHGIAAAIAVLAAAIGLAVSVREMVLYHRYEAQAVEVTLFVLFIAAFLAAARSKRDFH